MPTSQYSHLINPLTLSVGQDLGLASSKLIKAKMTTRHFCNYVA